MGGGSGGREVRACSSKLETVSSCISSIPLPSLGISMKIEFSAEKGDRGLRNLIGQVVNPNHKLKEINKLTHSAESSWKRELRWGVEELNVIVIRVSEREFGTLIRNIYPAVIKKVFGTPARHQPDAS